MIFKQVRGRKFSAGQKTIERLYLGTISLIVVPGKFGVLKTSKFAPEALSLGQIFVFRTSSFLWTTISRQFFDRNNRLSNYGLTINFLRFLLA